MSNTRDIFISYKNDGEGNNFAARLCADLEEMGYDVYYNPNEQHAGSFPDRLRNAIQSCKDFLLIVSKACLEQLMRNEKIDWVREEILIAHNNGKNIIPLLMPGVSMPKDKEDMPEALRFLPDTDAISVTDNYRKSPLNYLIEWIKSQPADKSSFKNVYQSNPDYDINEAFQENLKLAEAGNTKAMYELGNMYFYGIADEKGGSARSFTEACKWYQKAAETKDEFGILSLVMLGKLHYKGVVPREKQSYAKSLECYKIAAEESGYAKQQVAIMMSLGLGCEYDYDSAEQYYLSVIESGDNIAVQGLADFYLRYGEFKKAADLYTRIIDNFPQAGYELGKLYMQGVLSESKQPDYMKAAFYFHHAISAGYCDADVYYQLGLLYFRGSNGFMIDFRIAQDNFKIAAAAGHINACYTLGYMYEHGHVETNLDKALEYHLLAAEQGHLLSVLHLSVIYQYPKYQNYQKAFNFAKISADNGDEEGEYILGMLFFLGRGCEPDIDKAYELFKKSYHHGFVQGKFMMEKIEELYMNK